MSDFNKLKNYLNENKTNSSTTSNIGNSFMKLFNKSNESLVSNTSSNASNNEQSETDGWFREADNDPYCPKLSKRQRIIGFMLCLLMGVFCMFVASLYIPVLILKSRKFVLLFSTGSLFFIASFSLLWGLKSHLKHLISPSRLPFTVSYFGTLFATIYYAIWVKSVLITLIFAVLQIGSLIWYLVSYLPGGQNAFKLFVKLFYAFATKTVQTALPI